MKRIVLLLSLIVCVSLSANLRNSFIQKTDTEKEIDLIGSLISPQPRTVIKPIFLFLQAKCLRAYFNSSLGYLSIFIYDHSHNLRYEEFIDTSVQSNLLISTGFLETGVYTIEFTNPQGQYVQGTFEIEK